MRGEYDVFTKTKELGEAIKNCEEYHVMKAAEKKVLKNTQLSKMLDRYNEIDTEVEEEMNREEQNMQKIAALTEEMELLGESLKSYGDIVDMLETKESFSKLVYQVNTMLQFIVTGIKPNDSCTTCNDCITCSMSLCDHEY